MKLVEKNGCAVLDASKMGKKAFFTTFGDHVNMPTSKLLLAIDKEPGEDYDNYSRFYKIENPRDIHYQLKSCEPQNGGVALGYKTGDELVIDGHRFTTFWNDNMDLQLKPLDWSGRNPASNVLVLDYARN